MNVTEKLKQSREDATVLYRAIPETMRAYQGLMKAASKGGALAARIKELMALAIAVHARCEACVIYHVDAASRHGASREEVAETLAIAIEMGGGPATVYGGIALAAFDQLNGVSKQAQAIS